MKRFAGILAAVLLAGGAVMLWYPRVTAPHVQSAYEAAEMLEADRKSVV